MEILLDIQLYVLNLFIFSVKAFQSVDCSTTASLDFCIRQRSYASFQVYKLSNIYMLKQAVNLQRYANLRLPTRVPKTPYMSFCNPEQYDVHLCVFKKYNIYIEVSNTEPCNNASVPTFKIEYISYTHNRVCTHLGCLTHSKIDYYLLYVLSFFITWRKPIQTSATKCSFVGARLT